MAASVDSPAQSPTLRPHRELLCTLCDGVLQDPRMLLCAHSFCAQCLSGIVSAASDEPGLQELTCPSCSQATPVTAVDQLMVPAKFPEVISNLTDTEREFIVTSEQGRKKALADYKACPVPLVTSQCSEHNKPLDCYCDDCEEAVCETCTAGEHRSHSHGHCRQYLLLDLAHLESLVQPAHQFAARAEQAAKQLSQDCESIDANQKICKETVHEVFNQIRAAVDEREKSVLEAIENYGKEKQARVKDYGRQLNEGREKILTTLSRAEQLVEEIHTVQVIAEKESITDELDYQEQNILDIEEELFKNQLSSTYMGFKNDNMAKINKELNQLIALCEFYPDSDSGYYISRPLPGEDNTPGERTVIQTKEKKPLQYSQSFQSPLAKPPLVKVEPIKEMSEDSEDDAPHHAALERRHTTSLTTPTSTSPPVPIRFDSLVAPTPVLQPTKVFSKLSRLKTEVVNPCGVCIGENNSIVITDVKNHCLRIIASNGKFIDTIGCEGKGSGEFEEPCAIVLDRNNHFLVLEKENPRVQKFNSSGKYLMKFGQKTLRGSSLGEPWGVAIGPNKKIYITDWDKHSIHVFNSSGKAIRVLTEDSMVGDSLKLPAGIVIEPEGNILVVDRGSHCIWRLSHKGSIVHKIGSKGVGPGELFLPYGIALTNDGSIVVSESGNHRLSIFTRSGSFLKHFGGRGSDPGLFSYPRHVCVTKDNVLVVADELNARLQLFQL